ncbi:hypothetical protein C0J29_04665 [Mycobacterium paragordonae]|uniref:Glycosyl transferase family 28 C-terminal domain-containing protein n=1 Tax=Mycobacterium paragordonae TaxID=1389713 RepID=A0ABQ1BYA4_9MYCO|nr:glycosyltransferase [Mycobacterium paragordonae]AYE94188.1 hypothetical protein C0J29_04665 [Mycobacterium paragordonae]GFG77141.1 hypothetical protein MPRG_04170 [Mycobacterium paragordonae]
MIGYYIHHHGFGHLARAATVCARMHRPVTALTSLDIPDPHPFSAVVTLPRDDQGPRAAEPTAHGALHWAPHHDPGLSARMSRIADWVRDAEPEAFVVDVSVEVALFVRLLGIPVIVVALPGRRIDAPHLLVHRTADHIVAAWPKALCVPTWLRRYDHKTSYVGGISRFEGRHRTDRHTGGANQVLVLSGSDGAFGAEITPEISLCATDDSGPNWMTLGGAGSWQADPWAQICGADVVVTHAGQGCIADVAAAQRPAIVIPQPRPFGEQTATGLMLRQHRLAIVAQDWPDQRAWPALLAHADAFDPQRWQRWAVDGAARRAAEAIEATARLCRGGAS